MKQKGNLNPIELSLAFCALMALVLILFAALFQSIFGNYIQMLHYAGDDIQILHYAQMQNYAGGVFRALLAIPCIIFLGKIVQENGFKFSFSAKGFKKGMFAHLFFILAMALHLSLFFLATEINMEFIPMIRSIIFFDLANGVFEEVFMRGIFMTAMLVRFGETGKGRIFCVLLNGLVFGIFHVFDGVLLNVLFTGILGLGFAAAYVYSKNLLSCMIVHALLNITIKISNGLIADFGNAALDAVITTVSLVLLGAILLFAIVLTIKAKPLFKKSEPEATI